VSGQETRPLSDLIACRKCGSHVLVADYFVPESQGVLILGYDGDSFEFEYDGSTRSYDAGPDIGYRCRECGESAGTLEELCGLPAPAATREARERRTLSDADALDRLNLLLSAPEWPGASGMEDVAEIVRATGRQEVPDAPEWERH
jgi:hypothetical protein